MQATGTNLDTVTYDEFQDLSDNDAGPFTRQELQESCEIEAFLQAVPRTKDASPEDLPEDHTDLSADIESDPFADMEAFLQEEQTGMVERKNLALARARLKRVATSSQEAIEIREKIQEWETRREWKAEANVALFIRQACACGRVHHVFAGLMQRQRHLEKFSVQRWNRVSVASPKLPNETAFQDMSLGMCAECASLSGFDLSFGEVLSNV